MSDKGEEIDVYVTKYALTTGVYMARGTPTTTEYGGTAAHPVFRLAEGGLVFHGHWHAAEAAAVQRVREMLRTQRKADKRKADRLEEIDSLARRGLLQMVKTS